MRNYDPASPATASVGTSSASALAANTGRQGLIMTNTSTGSQIIYLGLGVAAEVGKGIVLNPGAVWYMDTFDYTSKAIFAIASASGASLAIQEF